MPGNLELTLLGNLVIRWDGVPVTDFKSRKAQALLCYLAVTGHTHPRPALASLLWGDMPERKARMNLSQALTKLRRSFGEYLTITRQTLAFKHDSDCWLKVSRYEIALHPWSTLGKELLFGMINDSEYMSINPQVNIRIPLQGSDRVDILLQTHQQDKLFH